MGVFDDAIGFVSSFISFGDALGVQDTGGFNENPFITLQDKKRGTSVRGRIISYSISNQADWVNRFEGMDADSKIPLVSAILQGGSYSDDIEVLKALTAKTLITQAQSIQVWTGFQPQSISLEIEFRAYTDPLVEVERPIQELLRMMSPELKTTSLKVAEEAMSSIRELLKANATVESIETATEAFGNAPSEIAITFFRKRFNATYRIESMEESVDEVKIDAYGNRIYQIISLTLGSTKGIMKSNVEQI